MYIFWLVLVSVVWGTTFFIVKDTVSSVNEYFLVFVRSFLAFAFIFGYQLFKSKKQLINKKAFLNGSILGILLATAYSSQTIGLKYTSTGHSAFITSSAVIIVPFILFFFYKTKILKIDWVAVIMVIAGLFLLTYDMETTINIGDIITITTAVAGAIHLVLAGRFITKSEALPLVTYQFLGASVVSLLAWLITGASPVVISLKSGLSLLYLGAIGTLFCYFVAVWVQKYVSSLKVAIIFSLEPVFAAIIGYFLLHEMLNLKEFAGTVMILAGVIIHSIVKHKSDRV
ncbi:MAG: DMT family transporter [Bacteroidales bacterium]|jgi:drug/metabolite transporter (DMT)-like permease|nr:DMT family transporter [Bacteroidales bacterium]